MPATPPHSPFLPADPSDYKQSLVNRMAELESLWSTLNYGKWHQADCQEMHRTVHNIRGSSAIFKHNALVEVAMRLEMQLADYLHDEQPPSFVKRDAMEQQLTLLNVAVKKVFNQLEIIKAEDIEMLASAPKETLINPEIPPLIYIVDDDPVQLKHLEQQLTPHNYNVKGYISLASLIKAFKEQPPQAIVADIVFPEGELAGIKTISRLTKAHSEKIPVIYISSRVDIATRLAAKRSGGVSYLTKPVNIPSLLHKIEEFTHNSQAFRVMIVDDDEIAANMHSLVLQRHNVITSVITEAEELMDKLHQFDPELILMDYRLPDCTGVELMELIRSELKYASLPIYVISGEISKLHQEEILNAGADDFLLKPVKTKLLVSMVRNRIKRERARSWCTDFSDNQDPVTGLYNRTFFLQRLTHSLEIEKNSQAAVLHVKIDRFIDLNSLLGLENANLLLEELAEAIQEKIAPKDLLARYNESSFTILGSRKNRLDFVKLGQDIRELFADFSTIHFNHDINITASIGISICWNTLPQQLMNEIEQLTQEASQEGGNLVTLSSYFNSLVENKDNKTDHLKQLISNIKDNKLQLKYQPIVSSYQDQTPRYEVLLEFFDDEGLSIQTRPLLRLAEKNNIMGKIDIRIINYAIKAIAQYPKEEMPTLFVKISMASIINKDLPVLISKYISGYKVNSQSLVFMLPSDNVWQEMDKAKFLIQTLKGFGCLVGLEYFGRKATDMQLLDRLPIDYVKFAPSIVRDITTNEDKHKTLQDLVNKVRAHQTLSILGFIEDADIMTQAWIINPDMMLGYFVQPPDDRMHFIFSSEAESTGIFTDITPS